MIDAPTAAELWTDVCVTVRILRTHSTLAEVERLLRPYLDPEMARFRGHVTWGWIKLCMFLWLCQSEAPQELRRAA